MKSKMSKLFLLILLTVFLLHEGDGIGLAKDEQEGQVGNKLSFWANVRLRYEYQDNFNAKFYGDNPKKGESNDGFLLGRFRFGLYYDPNEIIRVAMGVQHSEAWDVAFKESDFYNDKFGRRHNPYEDDWEPFDTYLEIRKVLPFSIKVGRQGLPMATKGSSGLASGETQASGFGMPQRLLINLSAALWTHITDKPLFMIRVT